MSDETRWSPFRAVPPRERPPRTELWTMTKGLDLRRAEIIARENGAAELQFFGADDQFLSGQRFLFREKAIAEAEAVREALEASGWTRADRHV